MTNSYLLGMPLEEAECLLHIFASKAFPEIYSSPLSEERELEKDMILVYDKRLERAYEGPHSHTPVVEWKVVAR